MRVKGGAEYGYSEIFVVCGGTLTGLSKKNPRGRPWALYIRKKTEGVAKNIYFWYIPFEMKI